MSIQSSLARIVAALSSRLTELGVRFLDVNYDAWVAQASGEWLRAVREADPGS